MIGDLEKFDGFLLIREAFVFIPGDPVGYYAQGARPNWGRMLRYREWKREVQAMVRLETGLRLPLSASAEEPAYIQTAAFFRSGVHPDPENVHKGVKDALFYHAKGGDKWTAGRYEWPIRSFRPGVNLWISLWRRKR